MKKKIFSYLKTHQWFILSVLALFSIFLSFKRINLPKNLFEAQNEIQIMSSSSVKGELDELIQKRDWNQSLFFIKKLNNKIANINGITNSSFYSRLKDLGDDIEDNLNYLKNEEDIEIYKTSLGKEIDDFKSLTLPLRLDTFNDVNISRDFKSNQFSDISVEVNKYNLEILKSRKLIVDQKSPNDKLSIMIASLDKLSVSLNRILSLSKSRSDFLVNLEKYFDVLDYWIDQSMFNIDSSLSGDVLNIKLLPFLSFIFFCVFGYFFYLEMNEKKNKIYNPIKGDKVLTEQNIENIFSGKLAEYKSGDSKFEYYKYFYLIGLSLSRTLPLESFIVNNESKVVWMSYFLKKKFNISETAITFNEFMNKTMGLSNMILKEGDFSLSDTESLIIRHVDNVGYVIYLEQKKTTMVYPNIDTTHAKRTLLAFQKSWVEYLEMLDAGSDVENKTDEMIEQIKSLQSFLSKIDLVKKEIEL